MPLLPGRSSAVPVDLLLCTLREQGASYGINCKKLVSMWSLMETERARLSRALAPLDLIVIRTGSWLAHSLFLSLYCPLLSSCRPSLNYEPPNWDLTPALVPPFALTETEKNCFNIIKGANL